MPRVTANNIRAALKKHASKHARLVTDEFIAYVTPGKEFPQHARIRHRDREYVRGDVHTNTVEGFFSLLKRGINGSFHHVSKGHLFRYVDEFSFRYNTRVALGSSRQPARGDSRP
jgi:ISXO2 transposase-like protein